MITSSGIHIQKIGGVEGTPTTSDIAVQAGRICRFGGAIWYPLLPHLVFVGLLAYRRSGSVANLLWGLLHDAHEVVTSDVPRPFKCDCMRTEQRAIDKRLTAVYLGGKHIPFCGIVDFDLISACDIDACDIEAVTLNLLGYAEIVKLHGRSYGKYQDGPYSNQDEQILFDNILASPFFIDTLDGKASEGVCLFIDALDCAEAGNYEGFLEQVKGWQL